ncbi:MULTISPECIES: nucleotide exchange factor GrpE [Streptomyces]|uniref:Protein GrpE n=1 Tax=Streptomyces dengpaensis TaxID=2049881 RepID=A0ABN5ICE1_9ACTN|nr:MULTISPECIES: nucleotide exchange factor GrpE [Streptomyces]AVH60654.1 nucleotide exchange factor GrpE [Streptomyces dengpaensis]PIB03545.1 nucleotide exchange factor GrpE [Streptomyces sp. HG99]
MDKGRLQKTDLTQLQRLLEERTADLQRVKAEYDNYRKRVHRDRMAVREIAVANVLQALLPVLDAVDRTCAHEPMTPGLEDITDTLQAQLGSLGLVAFGEEGDPFDPARHEAVTHHVAPDADQLICTEILRAGYRLGDLLVRPAYVEVTGPPPPAGNPLTHGREEPRYDAAGGSDCPSLTRAGHEDRGSWRS